MVTTGHRNYSTSPESRQLSTSKIYVAKEGHSTRDTTLTEKEFNKSQKSNEDSLKFFANVRQAGGTNLNILNHIPQYFKEPWAEPKKRLEFSPPIFQSNSNIEKPEIKFSTAEMRRQRREKENQNCERYYKSSYSDLVKLRLKELEKERLNLFNPATPESEAKKNICPWSFLKAPLKSNHQILQVPKNPPEQRSLTTRSKSNLSSKESSLATQTAISNSCLLTRNPIENSQDQRYYSKSKSKNKKNKRPKKLYERIDYNAGCDLCTPVIESLHHSDRRRIPLEPKRCESPKIVKKVYLPSNVKLGVSPCTIRPDYKHCKKEHKICPPRADECVVMATKKLPKLPTNNCPCIDPYIPHKAPKLEKLNLKFEDPPKQVCHVPMCETPRADDITPHKYKPLKPYVSGECECIQPPHMTDFTLKRLPKCEQEEICRPKRVCPVIEKCPPRADACLKLEPKQLPRIETSPCPCIDPHVPSLIPKLKRLNLTVPEPEKVCKTIFTCKDKERADDKIKLRKKKLPKFVPGDCPCEDKRMVDWNPKRLVCEEEARDCIVPDPCKEFPRADWGCWEYQDQICEAIDDKCIDDTVRCPPPPPPPKSRACHKHDPCKIHSGGIKEIRHLPKRKYSNSSASMKLYQQLKSHNVDDDVGCNKPSSKTYNPPKIKPSKSKNPKFVTSQKNLKITSKKFKSKSTLGLVKMLNDLENSKKTTEDPLLFKPIQDEKVNYEKILKQIASSTSVTLNKKEHKAGTLSPALKRSKSNTIKVASRAISTTKNVSRDENSLKQKRDIQGKKFLKNIKPTVKAMTCKKRCPNFALCKSPTREHRPGCRRERIPVCCEKEEPPYKAFTDNLEETIAPFTKTPQWTCNKMQFGYHPNYKKEHEPLDKMKKKDEKKSFSTCTVGPRCSSNSLGIVGVPTASRPTTAVGTRPVSNRSPLSVLKNPTKALLKKSSTSSIIITQNRTLSSKIFQLISSPPGKPKSNKKCLENAKDIPDRKKIGCIPLENESTFRPTYKKTYKRELNIVRKPPPFPAFSDCLDEEMEDILTECPLDKEKYLRMQPRFMNLTKPFSLKPPPPNQGKIDILKEQQCLRERLCIENEGVTQSCTDFGKPLPLLKIKKNQKNRDCEKVENLKKLGRWPPIRQTRGICSSTSALIAKSCRNLSTLGLNFIPEISKETSDTPGVKRLYIRNYHALIKGTDKAILGDNEAKLKEFTKKMFPDMDESTKLLKLRKNQWRIQNLKNYELLGPQRNVARCVKKFYCTYKTQRKYFLKRRLKGYTLKAYLGQRSGSNNATLLKHRSVCLRGTRLLKSERSKNTARKERSKSKPNKKEQQKFTLNNYSALQKKGGHRKSLEKFGHKHVSPFPAFSGRKKLARYTDLESLQPSYSIFSEHRAAPMQFPEQEKIDRSIGLEYYKCKHGLKNEGTTLDCQKLGFCGESKISGHCDSRIDSESSVSKLFVKEHKKIRRKAVDICNPSKAKARTGSSSKDQTKMSDNNECAKNRKKLKIGSSSKDHTKMNDNDECAKDIKKLQTICIDNCLKCIPSHLPEEEKYGVCKEECKNIFKKPNKLSSCDLRAPKNEDCEADIKKMCDCLRSTKNKKSEKVKVKDCLKATKNKKSEKVKSDCSLKSSSSTAMICPPAPCDPKRSKSITQLENLWQRIVNYFKARPNCPEPGEWKRRALREKAEKAAAAAGLIVLNPKCLPPEVLRKATVSTKDCKVCSNKDLCEKRDFDCETNKPASTKLNRRNFSTVIRQSRNFSRSVSSENLDEINKLLEKSELNKSKLSYSTSNTSLTKEFAIFPERKDAESSKALKLSLDRELYNNVDHKELYCKDEPYSRTYFGYSDILPSRENILERAWRISIESYNKCNYPRTYNFFNEFLNKMEKSIQSVEDLEKLKTENVLKELDEFLKNQDPDKNKK